MNRLEQKSVVITGAARGVGAAVALRAAREGALVTAVDVDERGLASLSRQAQQAGGKIQVVTADVSTADGNNRAISAAVNAHGRLDAFVANAAIIRFADTMATTEDDWDVIHRTNLKGVYLGIQAAVPRLRHAGGGSLVLIASVLGIVGDPLLPAYGATKGGLRAMCRSVAVAYGPENIRCNTICPGDVETEMMQIQFARESDPAAARIEITKHYPMRRFAQPDDVAAGAAFLMSDDAAYITGTDLVIDGGLLAKCY